MSVLNSSKDRLVRPSVYILILIDTHFFRRTFQSKHECKRISGKKWNDALTWRWSSYIWANMLSNWSTLMKGPSWIYYILGQIVRPDFKRYKRKRDRGSKPLASDPRFLGLLPLALFWLRTIKHCCVTSLCLCRFPPFLNSHCTSRPFSPLPPLIPLLSPSYPPSKGFFCTFLCRCFARLQLASRNFLVTRFKKEMLYVFLFTCLFVATKREWSHSLLLPLIFTLRAANISRFLTAVIKFPCYSYDKIGLLCFLSLALALSLLSTSM